jgi:hypothetical protein
MTTPPGRGYRQRVGKLTWKERDDEPDDPTLTSRFIFVGTKPAREDDPAFTAHAPVQDSSEASADDPS